MPDAALHERLYRIAHSTERVRLDILKDLIAGDMLSCRSISHTRQTNPRALATRVLAFHEQETVSDGAETVTMPTLIR